MTRSLSFAVLLLLCVCAACEKYVPDVQPPTNPSTAIARPVFTPTRLRAGQVVSLLSFFDSSNLKKMDIKLRFAGSREWVSAIGKDVYPVNGQLGVLYRVPQDAKNGKIEMKATGYETTVSDSVLTILPPLPALQPNTWTRISDITRLENATMPYTGEEGYYQGCAFVVNDKAYVAPGGMLHSMGNRLLWEYDPKYNSWAPKAPIPGSNITRAAAFAIDGKGYICTGDARPYQKKLWQYDPATDSWQQKADFPGEARHKAFSFVLGSKAYVGGGEGYNGDLNDVYAYDPATDKWTAVAPMPVARMAPYAFTVDGNAYVGGGMLSANYAVLTDMYMYDAAADAWIQKSGIPGNDHTVHSATFVLDGKAYVGLGNNYPKGTSTNKVYVYTPATDTWALSSDYASGACYGAVGFAIGNVGYYGTGLEGKYPQPDFWGYMVK